MPSTPSAYPQVISRTFASLRVLVLVCFCHQHPALQAGPMMAANAVEEMQQWHRYAGRG